MDPAGRVTAGARRAGRPPNEPGGPEPGRSYLKGLSAWISWSGKRRRDVAEELGIRESWLSSQLGNADRWAADQDRLTLAIRIIDICGGTASDRQAWIDYHTEVVRYVVTGMSREDPPRPPEPGRVRPAVGPRPEAMPSPAPPSAGLSQPMPSGLSERAAQGAPLAASAVDAAALERLGRLSDAAMRDVSVVIAPGALDPRGITLDDVYVPRNIEPLIMDRLSSENPQVVVGEPGYGKTSLLWRLHQLLPGQGLRPFLIKATILLASVRGGEARSPQALDLETLDRALRACGATAVRPVLLVDTLDLLMHSHEARQLVVDLLKLARRHRVRLLAACRPGEAALLLPTPDGPGQEPETGTRTEPDGMDETADAPAGLREIRIGLYTATERAVAIASYARAFCRPGGASLVDTEVAEIERRLLGVVYHGLPLREICDNPLTLRMLFDVYRPNPPDDNLDVASLYDAFWAHRVQADDRAGADGAADPAQVRRARDARLDLQATATELGRVMLAVGSPELSFAEAVDSITRCSGGQMDAGTVRADLERLAARGVLATTAQNATIRFFHQTFFEYAAAQFIVADERGGELVERVRANPGDLLVAAVAAQALPRLRSRAEADMLLRALLADDAQAVVTLGLSVYAHWSAHKQALLAETARAALRRAPATAVRRFLLLLPGTLHVDADRWPGDLREVWARGGERGSLRLELLETVSRLAGRDPSDVIDFLDENDCLAWVRRNTTRPARDHQSPYLRVLGAVYRGDPRWALDELVRFWETFAQRGSASGAADILAMIHDRIAALPADEQPAAREQALEVFRPLLPSLVDRLRSEASREVVAAYGRLWATGQPPPEDSDLVTLLRSTATRGPQPDPLARALLFRVGAQARTADATLAGQLLDACGDLVAPGLQTAMVDGILIPLLADDRGDDPMGECLATACRAALAELPCPDADENGTRSRPALFRDAIAHAGRTGARLRELLPAGADDIESWLRPDGLAQLTAAAAAAGHAVAARALRAWCTDPSWQLRPFATASPRLDTSLMTACQALVSHRPDMLEYLILAAAQRRSTERLVAALDLTRGTPGGIAPIVTVVESHRETLETLLADLLATASTGARRDGLRLWRALVERAGWPPPPASMVGPFLAGKPGTRLHTAAVELGQAALAASDVPAPDARAVQAAVAAAGGPNGEHADRAGASGGTPGWTWEETADLRPVLVAAEQSAHEVWLAVGTRRRADRAAGQVLDWGFEARHLRAAAVCRTGPIGDADQRDATIGDALDLVFTAGYHLEDADERGRFTKLVRELGRLATRLAAVDPERAATLFRRTATALHEVDPGITHPQREIANRWATPLGQVLAALGPAGRRRFVLDMASLDVSTAKKTVEIFARTYVPPPRWFRELVDKPGLHPDLRKSIRGNLYFYTRSHDGKPWHQLLDAAEGRP